MLHEVSGDILLSDAEAIAHGLAANDPMNQGLAEALHQRYPAMHKDFHHWCHQTRRDPGSAWIWSGAGGVRIVNLITQDGGYGHGGHHKPGKASVGNVNKALKSLKEIIESYAFRLLAGPGDEVLIPAPSYPLFDYLGRLNDLEILHYPLEYTDRWQVDFSTLRERTTPRTRAVLVVHPNNPTGSFIRRRELDSLIEICSRQNLALIADEVFADFEFAATDSLGESDSRVITHAAEDRALTFVLSGLSKISALPQMKLAWLIANGPQPLLRDALARLEIIADTYLSVSAPLACALPKLLATRSSIQKQILTRVHTNLTKLDEHLSQGSAVSRLHVEGGWYAILRVPRTQSDEDWAIRLVSEDGVLAHPGHFFDFASDGCLVVSLLPRAEVFENGIARILARVAKEA